MNDDEQVEKQSNTAVAGLVGAAIGSAATTILIDDDKRTKTASAIKSAGRKALDAAGSFKKEKTEDLQEVTEDVKTKANKILEDGKDTVKKTSDRIM